MLRPYITVLLALSLAVCSVFTSCTGKSSNFIVRDLTITPSEATAGEYILIEFWMDNKGYHGVLDTWTLEIDGEKVQSKKVRAAEGATTRAYFRITADEVGTHTVIIHSAGNDYLSGRFTVTEP